MKLFMIRHGQTYANEGNWYAGQSDAKLTELGLQQAKAVAPILADIPFDKVYTSDLSRAMITQPRALPGVTGTPLPILREYSIGSLTGENIDKAFQQYGYFHGDYTRFGGENTDMVCQRVREFLDILEAEPCDRVAAFCHNGTMKCMMRLVLGPHNTAAIENDNCNIAVFEYKNNAWSLLCWNYGRKL